MLDSAGARKGRPLLEVMGLVKTYQSRATLFEAGRPPVHAVDGVSFAIGRGEVVGLVGESGSGKSSIGRLVVRLTDPTAGQVVFDGTDITDLSRSALVPFRRRLQMAFQNSSSSLDPAMSVEQIVGEALVAHRVGDRRQRRAAVIDILERVGLSASDMHRRAASFSGGQRARIGLARALVLHPDLLVADEPTAALDASVQAQVVNLLDDFRRELGLAMLLITHDIGLVEHLCDRVLVMYAGRIVEAGTVEEVMGAPRHPYTAALLDAVPSFKPRGQKARILLRDEPSRRMNSIGCAFRGRCPWALQTCASERPALRIATGSHAVSCLRDPWENALEPPPTTERT